MVRRPQVHILHLLLHLLLLLCIENLRIDASAIRMLPLHELAHAHRGNRLLHHVVHHLWRLLTVAIAFHVVGKHLLLLLLHLKVDHLLRMLESIGKYWVTLSVFVWLKDTIPGFDILIVFNTGHNLLLLLVIVVHHQARVDGAGHRRSPMITLRAKPWSI